MPDLTVADPARHRSEGHFLLRPGNSDTKESSFLFNILVRFEGTGVGQQAFLHAGNIDAGEFETFRVVKRHQRDRFVLVVPAVDVGKKRYLGEKISEQRFRFSQLEFGDRRDEFLDILSAESPPLPFALLEVIDEVKLLHQVVHYAVGSFGLRPLLVIAKEAVQFG